MSRRCDPAARRPEMPPLLRRPASAGARPSPGRSSSGGACRHYPPAGLHLDSACAPAVTWQLPGSRGHNDQLIRASTLSGEPRQTELVQLGESLVRPAVGRFGDRPNFPAAVTSESTATPHFLPSSSRAFRSIRGGNSGWITSPGVKNSAATRSASLPCMTSHAIAVQEQMPDFARRGKAMLVHVISPVRRHHDDGPR